MVHGAGRPLPLHIDIGQVPKGAKTTKTPKKTKRQIKTGNIANKVLKKPQRKPSKSNITKAKEISNKGNNKLRGSKGASETGKIIFGQEIRDLAKAKAPTEEAFKLQGKAAEAKVKKSFETDTDKEIKKLEQYILRDDINQKISKLRQAKKLRGVKAQRAAEKKAGPALPPRPQKTSPPPIPPRPDKTSPPSQKPQGDKPPLSQKPPISPSPRKTPSQIFREKPPVLRPRGHGISRLKPRTPPKAKAVPEAKVESRQQQTRESVKPQEAVKKEALTPKQSTQKLIQRYKDLLTDIKGSKGTNNFNKNLKAAANQNTQTLNLLKRLPPQKQKKGGIVPILINLSQTNLQKHIQMAAVEYTNTRNKEIKTTLDQLLEQQKEIAEIVKKHS